MQVSRKAAAAAAAAAGGVLSRGAAEPKEREISVSPSRAFFSRLRERAGNAYRRKTQPGRFKACLHRLIAQRAVPRGWRLSTSRCRVEVHA
jgi:hypothetical protein